MISKVEKAIQELEYGLPENIRQIQMPHIPYIFDINLVKKDYYNYKGEKYTASGKGIFLIDNLPIGSAFNKVNNFNKSLQTSVNENLIQPFILFINDKAIKWSNIEIVYGRYSYILLSNFSEEIVKVRAIRIPYRVRYGEDNTTNINYKGNFYFDSQGLLTTNTSAITMRVEIISSELNCNVSDYSKGYIEVVSDRYDKPATIKNIICFKNGVLSDETSSLVDNGYNIFRHTGNTAGIIFKTFYYIKGNSSNDNIYKLDNSVIKANIIDNTATNYMTKLKEGLNLDISYTNKLESLYTSAMQGIKVIEIYNNKFLVCFKDSGNSNKGTAFVAEYVDGVLTVGPNYVFNDANTSSITAVKIDDLGRVLILFADAANNLIGKAIVVYASGVYMILGNAFTFSDASIFGLAVTKITKYKFVVAYSNAANSDYGTTQMLTFSNNYLSLEATPKYVFSTVSTSNISIVNTDNESVCVCYVDNIGYGCASIIMEDTVGILIGNKYIFNSDITNSISTTKLSNGRVLVTYIDSSSNIAVAQILNVDGDSISILPKYAFNSASTTYLKRSIIDDNNVLVVFNNVLNNMIYGLLNIVDNKISYNFSGSISYNTIGEICAITLYDKHCIVFTDTAQNNTGFVYFVHDIYNKFNMKLDKIMSYNPKLLESIYAELSPFECATYTGAMINAKKDGSGYITMPRRRYNNIFCHIIMFLNGELYENYHTVSYVNDNFKVLIGSTIADTDKVEFIFVKNVDNTITTLTVPSKDDEIIINSKFNEDNYNLFSTEIESREYELDEGTVVNYNVPFTVLNNGNNNYNITLGNDYYYGKSLNVVSENIFVYKKIIVEYNQVDVKLGNEFKYCINKGKYMVFINGRFINKSNFEVAIPNNYNPFEQVLLYINIIMAPGTEVEVLYLPFETADTYAITDIPVDGTIDINDSLIPFSLSSDHYWFFINGKKINPGDINNIGGSKVNIKNDYKSTYNFVLVQYMNPMDIVSRLFTSKDNWSNVVNLLGSNIKNFYQYINQTDTEIDIKENETDMKATILEAYRQYYAKYNISSNSLIFDFNDILINNDDRDSSGNYIIRMTDASKTNRADVDR